MTNPSPRHLLSPRNRLRVHLAHLRRRPVTLETFRPPKGERDLPRWVLWTIVALVVLTAGVVVVSGTTWSTTEGQRDVAAQQGTTLADQVAAACASGGDTAKELIARGACQQAAQIKADPVPGPIGPQGPGPTLDEIRGAVAAYMVANPPLNGRPPTPGEVAAAVAEYLTAHPPEPGRAPTAAEIAAATATYFASNPVRDGIDGKNGRPPTAEEIQAAVDAYIAAHPPAAGPQGPPGPTCPPGTTLLQVTYQDGRIGQGCVSDVQPTPAPLPLIGG